MQHHYRFALELLIAGALLLNVLFAHAPVWSLGVGAQDARSAEVPTEVVRIRVAPGAGVTADHGVSLTFSDDPAVVASVGKNRSLLAPLDRVSAYGMGGRSKRPEELRLNIEGRDIVTIYATGDVRLGEGLTPDEAARGFWQRVGQLAPTFCQGRRATEPPRK